MIGKRLFSGPVIAGLTAALLALPTQVFAWNNFPRTDLGYTWSYSSYPSGVVMYPAYPPYVAAAMRYQAAYPPEEEPVRVTVEVPASADIFFNGHKTTQHGRVREFISPPLLPGNYTYEVRVQMKEKGETVTQTRRVRVQPGDNVNLNFQTPSR